MYTLPLGENIWKHGMCYHICLWATLKYTLLSDEYTWDHEYLTLENCIVDINIWIKNVNESTLPILHSEARHSDQPWSPYQGIITPPDGMKGFYCRTIV